MLRLRTFTAKRSKAMEMDARVIIPRPADHPAVFKTARASTGLAVSQNPARAWHWSERHREPTVNAELHRLPNPTIPVCGSFAAFAASSGLSRRRPAAQSPRRPRSSATLPPLLDQRCHGRGATLERSRRPSVNSNRNSGTAPGRASEHFADQVRHSPILFMCLTNSRLRFRRRRTFAVNRSRPANLPYTVDLGHCVRP